MSTYGWREYRDHLVERRSQIDSELLRVRALQEKHQTQQQDIEKERQTAETDLVKALLPDFNQQTLKYCASWAGLPSLANDALAEQEKDRQSAEARLHEIEHEPLYIDRNNLSDPEFGTLHGEIHDLEIHCESLSSTTKLCENHPRWGRLFEVGYGTPQYKVGWWRLSYYQDWKAAGEIETLFKGQSFQKILENYQESRSSLDTLTARLAQKRRELGMCRRLIHEHQELTERLTRISEIHLEKTRQRLAHHLRQIPSETLIEQFRTWPALGPLLARYSALNAKTSYLQQMYDEKLAPMEQELTMEQIKIDTKLDRLRNPKNWNRDYEMDDSLLDKDQRIQQRLDRYDETYTTIYVYDRYDSVDLARDILWWDIFTGGRRDGSYISEVQYYHSAHPDYSYVRGQEVREDWGDNLALASASGGDVGVEPNDIS